MLAPSEATVALLRARVADPSFRACYADKLRVVPGSDCLWWTGAVSGKGHGRVFLGRDDTGRSHVVIAHRLAYALEHGVDALLEVAVLAHGCDNPLCQRVGPGHLVASTPAKNRRDYLARRIIAGTPLGDRAGSYGRARRLRDRLRVAGDLDDDLRSPVTQPELFTDPTQHPARDEGQGSAHDRGQGSAHDRGQSSGSGSGSVRGRVRCCGVDGGATAASGGETGPDVTAPETVRISRRVPGAAARAAVPVPGGVAQ